MTKCSLDIDYLQQSEITTCCSFYITPVISSIVRNSFFLISSLNPTGRATVKHYQQQSVMIQSSGIAIATVHTILVVIDIVGNCLVCAIIKKHRDMRYVETKITKKSQPV